MRLPALLLSFAAGLLAAAPAAASPGAAAVACAADSTLAACSDPRVEDATRVLSQRYAHVYATLPAAERAAFAARERRWLASGRWQEKDACVATHAKRVEADAIAAACLAEVTLQRAGALGSY